MAREQRKILIYPDAEAAFLERRPKDAPVLKGILELEYDVMDQVQVMRDLQRSEGWYLPGVTEDDVVKAAHDPNRQPSALKLLEPYTFVREQGGLLVAKEYRDLEPFRETMEAGAKAIDRAMQYVHRNASHFADPDTPALIYQNLALLMPAFDRGFFYYSRRALINMSQRPPIMLDGVLSDLYFDRLGLKYGAQSWLAARDDNQTRILNGVVRMADSSIVGVLRADGYLSSQEDSNLEVFAGDTVANSGGAQEMEYRGNTMPSENPIRAKKALSYINLNMTRKKARDVLHPRFPSYMQGEPLTLEVLFDAILLNMAGHEGVGHPRVDAGERESIRTHYTTLKEAGSELLGQAAILRIRNAITEQRARNTILVSLAWAKADIEDYLKEEDEGKKMAKLPYARAAAMILNYHLGRQSIELDESGKIKLTLLDRFAVESIILAKRIKDVAYQEPNQPGITDHFIKELASTPIRFLEGEGMDPGGVIQSSSVLAA